MTRQMKLTTFANNKAAILHFARKDKIYLFSYGALIMSQDLKTGAYFRHIDKDSPLLTATTMKHIKEFCCPQEMNKNLFGLLKQKKGA